MPSSIDIASNALVLIGDEPINSFSDPGAGARAVSNIYQTTKERFLSFHPWSFALKQQRLNLLSALPDSLSGFKYQFQMPTDIVRIWAIQPYQDYTVIGDKLLSNSNTAMLATYVYDVAETAFPPHAVKALEYMIAADIAISVTEDENKAAMYANKADTLTAQASTIDSQGRPQIAIVDSPFIEARFGGSGRGFNI